MPQNVSFYICILCAIQPWSINLNFLESQLFNFCHAKAFKIFTDLWPPELSSINYIQDICLSGGLASKDYYVFLSLMFDYFVILITFGIVTLIKCCFSINLWETKVLKIKATKRDLSVRQLNYL